jgi:flagellar basal body-associated protein FliL
MAEDQGTTESGQDLSTDEAAELERLLDGGGEEGQSAGGLQGIKAKFQKILSDKKLLMLFGGGLLVLILAIGAGVYFLQSEEKVEEVPVEEQAVEEEVIEEEEVKVEKVNIYKLDPFFLPILEKGKETGRFMFVSPNLLLSNRVLNREIDKVLPLLRNSIYKILKRKKTSDFTLKQSKTEERIKKEILTASNALLLSGTGTITDVYFTRFMVK